MPDCDGGDITPEKDIQVMHIIRSKDGKVTVIQTKGGGDEQG